MADAVLYRALQDIQGAIRALDLAGIDGANVVIEKMPTDRNQPLPAVIIAPAQEELPRAAGTNDRDDVTYHVAVALLAADNQDQSANFEQELEWRQKIRRQFHLKRLGPATTESVVCYVRPSTTIHPQAWSANLFLSLLIIECLCRESRTP